MSAGASTSPCSSALQSANAYTAAVGNTGMPLITRYVAAEYAANRWSDVASACAARFTQGTIRSAQALHMRSGLARFFGQPDDVSDDAGTRAALQADASSHADLLRDMSLAEDRAGFSMEILAARAGSGSSLALSDIHKTMAQTLFSTSGSDSDPRQKVYSVSALVNHTQTITDPATGLSVPTAAAVEISCAREELHAASSSSEPNYSDEDAHNARDETMVALSRIVGANVYRALERGYPATDAALFQ